MQQTNALRRYFWGPQANGDTPEVSQASEGRTDRENVTSGGPASKQVSRLSTRDLPLMG